MKNFIYKINTYLIEKHPIIWNTKLIWMLSASFIIHFIFFILGFLALRNPKLLHKFGAKDIFFDNGTVFISVILSILLLVIWLIYLFKNNAFKSFYPASRLKLFKQYLCYLVIVFYATTFYLSYNVGLKNYISNTYDDSRISKEVTISNDAALFFSQDIKSYTIDQRKYPEPFNTLYCEVNGRHQNSRTTYNMKSVPVEPITAASEEATITVKPYTNNNCLNFLNDYYCYYTLYSKEGTSKNMHNDSTYAGYVFTKTKDTTYTFFYKDTIVDITRITNSAYPSYYNYSKTFYNLKSNSLDKINSISYSYEHNNNNSFSKEHEIRNKKNHDLLKRNDSEEIKQLLTNFLNVLDSYKVKHNLSTEEWFNLVYHPNSFELKSLIRKEPKSNYEYTNTQKLTLEEEFKKNHLTNYYISKDNLHNVFTNIDDIKTSHPFWESIHFFLWFTIILTSIILIFRVTGLKPLLFTIITAGVLCLIVALLGVFYGYVTKFNGDDVGFFVLYLTFILGTIILAIPIFYSKKIKKLIVAICLSMSIFGFVFYVLLILGIISMHQSNTCRSHYPRIKNEDCFILLESLGLNWSFILVFINLVFIYFYFGIIKKWKALPEG